MARHQLDGLLRDSGAHVVDRIDQARQRRSSQLRQDVLRSQGFGDFTATAQHHGQGHCWVEVTTRNVAHGIDHAHHHGSCRVGRGTGSRHDVQTNRDHQHKGSKGFGQAPHQRAGPLQRPGRRRAGVALHRRLGGRRGGHLGRHLELRSSQQPVEPRGQTGTNQLGTEPTEGPLRVLAATQPQRQRHGRVQRRAADVAAGVAAAQEGETDGQAEALIGFLGGSCSAVQNHKDQKARVEGFSSQGIAHMEGWHRGHHGQVWGADDLVDRGGQEGTHELEDPVAHHFAPGLLSQQRQGEGHRGVQLSTADVVGGIDHDRENRGDGQRRPGRGRGRGHGAAHGEDQDEGAESFSDQRCQPSHQSIHEHLLICISITCDLRQDLLRRHARRLCTASGRARARGGSVRW
mmetsp:Transcript_37333/g.80385  ORF Transcript_37333/g.80385 Transcript_37333/m.80385 type:complete len:404 (+) Transcript_37333:513-1724(+)